MNQLDIHHGYTTQTWLQHHMPWLALLALLFGLHQYEADQRTGFDPDELNG